MGEQKSGGRKGRAQHCALTPMKERGREEGCVRGVPGHSTVLRHSSQIYLSEVSSVSQEEL